MNEFTVYKVQTFNYAADRWETQGTYDTDGDVRAEENAFFSYSVQRKAGPSRLLKDGVTLRGNDDPDDYYNQAD